ncbi:transcriptional regulator, GntR family [Terribacillus aidingensis]|uniref:Trehalose operon repressor n=1 Tax=Terribacillus aidingensis TaxID=586416 RepID=A0A285P5M2_9BACI|nr:trehalose operon repressor [Terribacillus aidingensis]SNZ17020.1 transcriptional regulator, GntR family [Terribacillus aidingensis]
MQRKFQAIYDLIAREIQAEKMEAGQLLPSENELTERFETSRETVRKALQLLSQNGYIQKLQGKGSVVLEQNKLPLPVSGLTSFKELARSMSQTVETQVLALKQKLAEGYIQEVLQCEKGTPVWELHRLRKLDGEAVIYDKDLLLAACAPALTEAIARDSIYDYLEQDVGLSISYARKEVVVEEAGSADAEVMDMGGYQQLAVVRSAVYLEDTTLFQYTESKHRPDKFRFVDFARRTK